jgi:hypothetical protein
MKLTSSNFGAALGLNPWMSRQKLFRVMTGKESRDPLNDKMAWGLDHEHDAVAAVEAHTGLMFDYTGKNQQHIERACYGTTPDGSCGHIGLEVKCPSKLYDDVPAHYMVQVQGQAWLAGFEQVYFGAWTPEETRIWRVDSGGEYVKWMMPLLTEFMTYVQDDVEPKRKKKVIPPEVITERIL